MKYRHYAPEAKLLVYDNKEKLLTACLGKEQKTWLLTNSKIASKIPTYSYSCQTLYYLFRQADSEGIIKIYLYLDE